MLFNSFHFIIFFPLVVFAYFFIAHRFRWLLLLIASYYFYMAWNPAYVILIMISTIIDYFAALMMGRTDKKAKRRTYLILSLVSNLGLLFIFKYFNFFNEITRSIATALNYNYTLQGLSFLLPLGISFYTFQTLSYTIDVYRGVKKPEKHLGIFALYVSFFPQLVAGPIERSTHLLPQFKEKHEFDYNNVTNGLKLMAWGYFKKLVIADRLAVIVNQVYNDPTGYTGLPLVAATVLFAFQIFCDFSGYSDIAIGAGEVMGFNLMKNFNRPYFADSIYEFWKRWHISLSTWFRDYVYIPLGGNRVVKRRWAFNILTTFLLSGLWHGANWTFIIWGALHGLYYIFSVWTKGVWNNFSSIIRLNKFPMADKLLRVIITFGFVSFSWIFFRARNLKEAFYVIENIFNMNAYHMNALKGSISGLQLRHSWLIIVISIMILELVHLAQRRVSVRKMLSKKPVLVRWTAYYFLLFAILLFGIFEGSKFIYFQF